MKKIFIAIFFQAITSNIFAQDKSECTKIDALLEFMASDEGSAAANIKGFTETLSEHPNFYMSYFARGIMKRYLKDYRGAIIDFSKTIEICKAGTGKPIDEGKQIVTLIKSYIGRAASKASLENGDLESALLDMDQAEALINKWKGTYNIEEIYLPKIFLFKGAIKIEQNDKEGACKSFSKAGDYGCEAAYKLIQKYCK
jgi:tetratricopeptide (TPR) repeat protein